MAYQADKPKPTDQLSQSQADILGNFQALAPLLLGLNNYLVLAEQVNGPATAVNQMALYTKDVGGTTAMFIRPEGTGPTGAEVDFTSKLLTTTDGWTRLPSGILLKWGLRNNIGPGLDTVTYPVGVDIPAFTSIPRVTVNAYRNVTSDPNWYASMGVSTTTTFDVFCTERYGAPANPTVINIYFFAIGV